MQVCVAVPNLYQTFAKPLPNLCQTFKSWQPPACRSPFLRAGRPPYVQPFVPHAFRKYPECRIFADGFAKACVTLLDTTASSHIPAEAVAFANRATRGALQVRQRIQLVTYLSVCWCIGGCCRRRSAAGKELCRPAPRRKASARQLRAVLIDKIYEVFTLLRGRLSADEISNG